MIPGIRLPKNASTKSYAPPFFYACIVPQEFLCYNKRINAKEELPMKKKSLLILLLILTLCVSLFMTACGGSSSSDSAAPADTAEEAEEVVEETEKTLEDMNAEENFLDDITDESGEMNGVAISFEGNDVIYTYDFSNTEGVTEEAMKDPTVVNSLQEALETGASDFVDMVKELESQTGITGIRVVVNYTWADDILCTATFDSEGLVD
jgi:hypothetical protein